MSIKIKAFFETVKAKKNKMSFNTEEADDLKISIVKNQLSEIPEFCQIQIVCHAPDKEAGKALRNYLMRSEKFSAVYRSKSKGVWSVRIVRNALLDDIKNELIFFREAINLHSCVLVDWEVKVAELG